MTDKNTRDVDPEKHKEAFMSLLEARFNAAAPVRCPYPFVVVCCLARSCKVLPPLRYCLQTATPGESTTTSTGLGVTIVEAGEGAQPGPSSVSAPPLAVSGATAAWLLTAARRVCVFVVPDGDGPLRRPAGRRHGV